MSKGGFVPPPYTDDGPQLQLGDVETSSGRSRNCRRAGVVGAIGIVAAVAVTVGVVALGESFVEVAALPAPGSSVEVYVAEGRRMELPRSSAGQVNVLFDQKESPIARSYDGGEWTPIFGESAECDESLCRVASGIEGEHTLVLSTFASTIEYGSADQLNARFLLQATFGPTRESMDELNALGSSDGRFKKWIEEQMEMPQTLHREHFRSRVNYPLRETGTPGRPSLPCEKESRWHQFAFTLQDVGKEIEVVQKTGFHEFSIDGIVRYHATDIAPWGAAPYRICAVDPVFGGNMKVGNNCRDVPNPPLNFQTAPPADRLLESEVVDLEPQVAGVKILPVAPADCTPPGVGPMYLRSGDGTYYMHDPRLALFENSVERPADEISSGDSCPNVPMNFINKDSCVVRAGACSPPQYADKVFTLNEANIRKFYSEGGKYVYSIAGIETARSSACQRATRWQFSTGACANPTANLNANTKTKLVDALTAAFRNDDHPFLRDIFRLRDGCAAANSIGAKVDVQVDGTTYCFSQVYRDMFNVYDFSGWSEFSAHPGNQNFFEAGLPNPIKKPAEELGATVLTFPASHPFNRWTQSVNNFEYLGRLGDKVNFRTLPNTVQSAAIARAFGALVENTGTVTIACGSPGETANKPLLGSRYGFNVNNQFDADPILGRLDEFVTNFHTQSAVWNTVAIKSKDQLRQRVAWSLSQVVVASASLTGGTTRTEQHLAFHDMFVRHAFGNYRDILRETSYSPVMAVMLSYLRSQSMPFVLESRNVVANPDENYAREIMQLFSVGLFQLHPNGTKIRDANGNTIPTYSNEDILTGARAWTGFDRQPLRSNIETVNGPASRNEIDPMQIVGEWRDPFPKLGLDKTYIGEGYPLCEDLPEQMFLRPGAAYRFLGSSPSAVMQTEPTASLTSEESLRVELGPDSALFKRLCNAESDTVTDLAQCRFNAEITLDEIVPCSGTECELDTVRTVMLTLKDRSCPKDHVLEKSNNANNGDICRNGYVRGGPFVCPTGCEAVPFIQAPFCIVAGSTDSPCRVDPSEYTGLFFEYIRPPCVHMSFYEGGLRVANSNEQFASCAHPKSTAAGDACCNPTQSTFEAFNECRYGGEQMRFETSKKRCASQYDPARETCDYAWIALHACPQRPKRFWSEAPCSIQVKVRKSDKKIAIVHDVGQSNRKGENTQDLMLRRVNNETTNWFRAVWDKEDFSCDGCVELPDGESCLCDTEVIDEPAVTSMPVSSAAAAGKFRVGSVGPEVYGPGEYTVADQGRGIKAFKKKGGSLFDTDTIFEVMDSNRVARYYRNVKSVVQVGSGNNARQFRNPPTFHLVFDPEARDAAHETEAFLDHYVSYPSTAPFIAMSLIKHLVTSNPSPAYVEVVSKAFTSGKYRSFGSGKLGDLGATVAAVLLESEARNHVLDIDPTYGQHREAMIKIIHLMRSMEATPRVGSTEFVMRFLQSRIGMDPLDAPSVFSYYLPEYSPPSLVASGLVAPETQLLTSPLIIGFLNGVFSMIKYGLSSCEEGFGLPFQNGNGQCRTISGNGMTLDQKDAHASLKFTPSNVADARAVVDELDLLLSAGRLDPASKSIMEEVYAEELATDGTDPVEALRVLQHLFVSSPQFHTTSKVALEGPRAPAVPQEASPKAEEPYKAVVYVFLAGGMDSFSALVPKSGCGANDLYAEYASIRGPEVAIAKEDLLDIDAAGQVCSTFGLHPELKAMQKLYDEEDAIFMSNVGNLVEPFTKTNNAERPNGLFAHNLQQRGILTNIPQDSATNGVMGRALDDVIKQGYRGAAYSLDGNTVYLNGEMAAPDILDRRRGATPLDRRPLSARVAPAINELNEMVHNELAEEWAKSTSFAINRSVTLSDILASAEPELPATSTTELGEQLQQVAKLMKARDQLGANRNAFFTQRGGFDTHDNGRTAIAGLLAEVDTELDSFVKELKAQGLWNDVVIVVASEFGRTLTNNGVGTDHAWGGNYWMLGGSLKGKQILGEYPADLKDGSSLNLGRGRFIPTTSWDAVWNAVGSWFGVSDMQTVLPNMNNFAGNLFTQEEVFSN